MLTRFQDSRISLRSSMSLCSRMPSGQISVVSRYAGHFTRNLIYLLAYTIRLRKALVSHAPAFSILFLSPNNRLILRGTTTFPWCFCRSRSSLCSQICSQRRRDHRNARISIASDKWKNQDGCWGLFGKARNGRRKGRRFLRAYIAPWFRCIRISMY